MSQVLGGPVKEQQGSQGVEIVSACQTTTVLVNGKTVKAVLDTGSEVTILSKRCFYDLFGDTPLEHINWLKISSADDVEMPYLGYFEADIQLGKEIIVGRGILVLAADRDPPMLVGLNVIKDMDPAYLVQELGLSTDTPKAKPQPNIQGLVRVCGTRVIVPPESVKVISVSCPVVQGSDEVELEPLT